VGSRPSLKALEKRNLLPVPGIQQPVDQVNYGLTKFDICQPCTVLQGYRKRWTGFETAIT